VNRAGQVVLKLKTAYRDGAAVRTVSRGLIRKPGLVLASADG